MRTRREIENLLREKEERLNRSSHYSVLSGIDAGDLMTSIKTLKWVLEGVPEGRFGGLWGKIVNWAENPPHRRQA